MSKTTKTILWVIAAIIVIGLVWYAVSKKPETVTKEEETIKIGVMVPLSGSVAESGQEEVNGIILAINEKPIINGKKIELFIEDSKNDPKEGISVFRRLVDINKIDFLFGAMSSIGLALTEQIKEEEIPTLWIAAHPDLLKDNPWIFRNLPTSSKFILSIVNAIEKENIAKVGVFYLNDDLGDTSKTLFVQMYNGEITDIEMFDKEGKDFKTQISKLLATQPDAIFLAGYGTAGGILIKQLREMSYNGEIFGIPEIVTTNTVEAAQEAMDKVIFPDYAPDYKAGEAAEFRAKYLSSFNKEPGADSLLAYEGARILLYAIEQTDGSKEAVRSYICTLSNFPGIMGPISVQNNEIQHFLVMREFIKGEKTLYTK